MASPMTTKKHELIAVTDGPGVELALDKMPVAGALGQLTVLAIMENETRDNDARLNDQSSRPFLIRLILSKQTTFPDKLNYNFTRNDGASYVTIAAEATSLSVRTTLGAFEVELNDRRELSLIRTQIQAVSAIEARDKAYNLTVPFLDSLSFWSNTPIITGLMEIYDEINQAYTIDMMGPERTIVYGPGVNRLFAALEPIYGLYREFKNSDSTYYRLLCLYKIMEGVFGPLRRNARKEAKRIGAELSWQKEFVPSHPHIAPPLRYLVGKPIKEFYDTVLQKEYRDTVSHFLVRENVVLKVSSAAERFRFAEMTFLSDLCVRVLISNHEQTLHQLAEAEATRPT
jgi:hypothetical protein